MTKTSFELQVKSETLEEATRMATLLISDFLKLDKSQDISKLVDMEFRVKNSDDLDGFVVTVYASVKRN